MKRRDIEFEPPYAEALEGILKFSSLAECEQTLARLDALMRRYEEEHDARGKVCCRRAALKLRRRAEQISRNPRVDSRKRREKEEIARWAGIWLETPSLFSAWLEMRKQTEEYQELAGDG